jgi:uncharacterized cofD-like protein
MLRGLKFCSDNITAIVTVMDDGGGSGMLRQDLGMLPPGDIRNCLLALANTEHTLRDLLHYRFREGSLTGQSFGNLFLAALNGICGSFDEAVSRMGEVLAITGRVLPVTTADVHLKAEFEDGASVVGESGIIRHKKQNRRRIRRVELLPPHPDALPDALQAIREADMILIGPGSLYTSIIPNLLVEGVPEAIAGSSALKVYVCNVMTQEGETEGYTAFDHLRELSAHAGQPIVDVCLANSARIPESQRTRYEREGAEPMVVDRERILQAGIELVEWPLTDDRTTYARHDPFLLSYALLSQFFERCPRTAVCQSGDELILSWLRESLG